VLIHHHGAIPLDQSPAFFTHLIVELNADQQLGPTGITAHAVLVEADPAAASPGNLIYRRRLRAPLIDEAESFQPLQEGVAVPRRVASLGFAIGGGGEDGR
jgi:hypothetical protein